MQQLTCSECGTRINSNNINVQEMVAVCHQCDTVFSFTTPDATKSKRRKMKQPEHLTLEDGHHLKMGFRTNWRLDADEQFALIGSMTFLGVLMTIIMVSEFSVGDVPILFPMMFAMMTGIGFYSLGLRLYNQTYVEMQDDQIAVYRAPIPNVLKRVHQVNLADVVAIHCEETSASVEHEYDTPRFKVFAETVDGRERLIITDVVEDYGFFIAQQLDKRLHGTIGYDASHLEDSTNAAIDYADEMTQGQQRYEQK